MKDFVSKCCGKPMKIGGSGDGSHWWECLGCGKPTDPVHFKKFRVRPSLESKSGG